MARKRATNGPEKGGNTANLGFEAKLWLAADKLHNNMDAAEYKHVVLGLIFLKYISDSFEEHHSKLVEGKGDYAGANPEDPDEYRAENIFWVPPAARWSYLQNSAKQPTIGKIVDDAMVAIERDNPRLKGVLPKDYARPALDKHRLGELIDLIGTISLIAPPSPPSGERAGVRGQSHRSVDLLGRVYEYFLTQFASAEGKNGGQFYTPSCVVRLLVEMLAPYKGRIYDPACGSGGMFALRSLPSGSARKRTCAHAHRSVQSEKFVESHGGKLGDISVYGQERNATTRRLAIMNLAIRGIEADFGPEHADTFRRDLHPDLRADYVLAKTRADLLDAGLAEELSRSLLDGKREEKTRAALLAMQIAFECRDDAIKVSQILGPYSHTFRQGFSEMVLSEDLPSVQAAAWALAWFGNARVWSEPTPMETIMRLFKYWREGAASELVRKSAWAISSQPLFPRDAIQMESWGDCELWLKSQWQEQGRSEHSGAAIVVGWYRRGPWSDTELAQMIEKHFSHRAFRSTNAREMLADLGAPGVQVLAKWDKLSKTSKA